LLREGSSFVLGLLPSNGSFYLPTRLTDHGLRPVTTPHVRLDEAASTSFPTISFSYALEAWRPRGVALRRSAVINGEVYALGSQWFERGTDGKVLLSVGEDAFVLDQVRLEQALTLVARNGPDTGLNEASADSPGFAVVDGGSSELSEANPAAAMAATIARVCVAAMRTGEMLSLDDFGAQFVFDETRRGVTTLRHARGQPWVRLSINGSRPGSCSASFSDAGANSVRAANNLADEIRAMEWRRSVSVPGLRQAFTFPEFVATFSHDEDPYIAYLPVAGYQAFFFMPPASSAGQ
jgi:hypothetical protein